MVPTIQLGTRLVKTPRPQVTFDIIYAKLDNRQRQVTTFQVPAASVRASRRATMRHSVWLPVARLPQKLAKRIARAQPSMRMTDSPSATQQWIGQFHVMEPSDGLTHDDNPNAHSDFPRASEGSLASAHHA
jgi:hypothetical protein